MHGACIGEHLLGALSDVLCDVKASPTLLFNDKETPRIGILQVHCL